MLDQGIDQQFLEEGLDIHLVEGAVQQVAARRSHDEVMSQHAMG